jgi:hypothetical protein
MAETSALYYKSLGIASTLLRMGKILNKLYMRVMTYKALVFPAIKYLGNYYR